MKHNVEWVKKLAKKIKKTIGVPHHVALDLAAQEIGFQNYKHFINDENEEPEKKNCLICGREIFPDESHGKDSLDCGGDCWGCIKEFENGKL